MKYNRTFNFSAGPAMMPEPVLEEIRDEMMNYRGSGMCVMEMSHRSKVFQQIIDEAEADLRDLMNIPDNYKVLFIQGGATLQFAASSSFAIRIVISFFSLVFILYSAPVCSYYLFLHYYKHVRKKMPSLCRFFLQKR